MQSNGAFRKTNVRPKTGRQFKKDDFKDIIEALKNVDTSNLEASFFCEITEEDIRRERALDAEEGDLTKIFDSNSIFNDNSLITMLMSDDYKPLGDMSRTNIFDLRKNIKGEEDMTGAGRQVAGSGLETEIASYDPSIGPSIWESFSRSIG